MKRSLLGILAILFATGCGDAAETPAPAPTSETTTTTTIGSVVGPSTTRPPETTFPIEMVRIAEANGLPPEEAEAILHRQQQQGDALIRLHELVGEGVIVDAAFHEDFRRADELTVFVVDEQAVAMVGDRIIEAGLDPAKTTVEVAPEQQPEGPWDWLKSEPYARHDWHGSPGPHIFGAWQLVESNDVPPEIPLVAAFVPARWSLEPCSVWMGRSFSSAKGNVTLTVDRENLHCEDATDTVEQVLLKVIEDNGGEFAISFEEERMMWAGSVGDDVVWQLDESINGWASGYPPQRSKVYDAWRQSPGPAMEGIWQLQEVGGKDPTAPVSLFVGVSTLGFEGQCNAMEGLFALSSDHRLATNLYRTAMGCGDPTEEVEEQIHRVLSQHRATLQVSVEGETMIWGSDTGPQMIWSR